MREDSKCCEWTSDDPILVEMVGKGEWWNDPEGKAEFLRQLNERFKFLPDGTIERR